MAATLKLFTALMFTHGYVTSSMRMEEIMATNDTRLWPFDGSDLIYDHILPAKRAHDALRDVVYQVVKKKVKDGFYAKADDACKALVNLVLGEQLAAQTGFINTLERMPSQSAGTALITAGGITVSKNIDLDVQDLQMQAQIEFEVSELQGLAERTGTQGLPFQISASNSCPSGYDLINDVETCKNVGLTLGFQESGIQLDSRGNCRVVGAKAASCDATFEETSGKDVENMVVSGSSTTALDSACCKKCDENPRCEFWVREAGGSGSERRCWLKREANTAFSSTIRRGAFKVDDVKMFEGASEQAQTGYVCQEGEHLQQQRDEAYSQINGMTILRDNTIYQSAFIGKVPNLKAEIRNHAQEACMHAVDRAVAWPYEHRCMIFDGVIIGLGWAADRALFAAATAASGGTILATVGTFMATYAQDTCHLSKLKITGLANHAAFHTISKVIGKVLGWLLCFADRSKVFGDGFHDTVNGWFGNMNWNVCNVANVPVAFLEAGLSLLCGKIITAVLALFKPIIKCQMECQAVGCAANSMLDVGALPM